MLTYQAYIAFNNLLFELNFAMILVSREVIYKYTVTATHRYVLQSCSVLYTIVTGLSPVCTIIILIIILLLLHIISIISCAMGELLLIGLHACTYKLIQGRANFRTLFKLTPAIVLVRISLTSSIPLSGLQTDTLESSNQRAC